MLRILVLLCASTLLSGCLGLYLTRDRGVSKVMRDGEVWFVMSSREHQNFKSTADEVCPDGWKEDKDPERPDHLYFTCTAGNVNWKRVNGESPDGY